MTSRRTTNDCSELGECVDALFHFMIERFKEHISTLELTAVQVHALRTLSSGPITTGQLASRLDIAPPSVTQLTDRLVRKGLIERAHLETDRRAVRVGLTRAGKRVLAEISDQRTRAVTDAIERLSPEDRETVIAGFEKLKGALAGESEALEAAVRG